MRLSKLRLYGFKSFADKTEFAFDQGLTALVGPNGCGKSNVVDAVRWVLGEQRPKALRGSEMADVIFKGNGEGRGSLSFAEVTISLSNEDRVLPVEYDEVAITRRLYRSGESEYLINNQTCRLRDIRELLMDTGIGMDAYSIVEQGKIDLILQSSPMERRTIFEEAAGISKYNAKRRAALSKLERVGQNLLRLGDTIEEVGKRLRSIKRQAATARRYKQHAESLDRLRLAQSLHEYHRLLLQRAETEKAIVQGQDQQGALSASIEQREAERSGLDAETIANDQHLARLDARLAEMRAQRESLEESIRLNRERIQDVEAGARRTRENLENLASRVAGAHEEIASTEQRIATVDEELAQAAAGLDGIRGELQQTTEQRAELARLIDSLRAEGLDCLRERAGRQNEVAGIQSDCRALEAQRERHQRRRQEVARLLEETDSREQANRGETGDVEAQVERTRARFAMRAEERGELRAQIESADEQVALQTNALTAHTSRRDLLLDLEERCEGVEVGTQRLLARAEGSQHVHGMVADLVQVDTEYAVAIEAALGGAVQHLVTDTLEGAAEAVGHLKSTDGGRSTLIPLDRMNGNGHNGHSRPDHPGILGSALELVRYDPAVEPAVRHLLSDTFVVRDLESAVEIAREHNTDIRLATLGGDVLHPRGFVSGGSEHERTGLLSRKNELRALNAEIEEIEQRLEQVRSQRDHFITESSVLDGELEETRQQLNELNLRLATLREQGSRQVDRREGLTTEDQVVEAELQELANELGDRRRRAAEVATELEALDAREQELKARLDASERERASAEERRAVLDHRFADLSVRQARGKSEREHMGMVIERLRAQVADARSAEEHGAAELEALEARRQGALDEIATKEEAIREIIGRLDAVGAERVSAENHRAELAEKAAGLAEEVRGLQAALRAEEQKVQELRLSKNEHDLRISGLSERVREEHRREIAELYRDYEEPEVDWDEVASEVADLKRKLDSMGTVNLLAIDEQEELETRHEFLSTQEQDLLRAKHALQEVIRKVNRRSRQLFEQTFAAVRANFQGIYRKLFGGGKADIILEAGADVLEAGVEIIAKPPGKEPSSIRLLSGGEKSLTAVALLLAIFKSRPSPFCILDEVDAALDDANVGRFVGLVKEFLKDSQFLIVTHSKQTMSVADALYGVTMQEAGVSRHIAVKLEDVDEIEMN